MLRVAVLGVKLRQDWSVYTAWKQNCGLVMYKYQQLRKKRKNIVDITCVNVLFVFFLVSYTLKYEGTLLAFVFP